MKEELMRARTTCGIEPCGFTHRFRLPDGTYTWLSSSGCTHVRGLLAACVQQACATAVLALC
jgi:hypothetical protein